MRFRVRRLAAAGRVCESSAGWRGRGEGRGRGSDARARAVAKHDGVGELVGGLGHRGLQVHLEVDGDRGEARRRLLYVRKGVAAWSDDAVRVIRAGAVARRGELAVERVPRHTAGTDTRDGAPADESARGARIGEYEHRR